MTPARHGSCWLLCGVLACTTADDSTTAATTGTTTGTSEDGDSDSTDTSTQSTGAADSSSTETGETTGDSSSESSTDESSTGATTCPEVEFVYSVAFDPTPGNSCDAVLGATNTCSVTQTDCQLSWGCNGAFENLLPPGPIDAAGVYVGEGMFMGTPVECVATFTADPRAFEFACNGRDIECTGGGF